jgi:hypothetical protein
LCARSPRPPSPAVPIGIAKWFTEDFRLIEPAKPEWPLEHVGSRQLLDAFAKLAPVLSFDDRDMIEEQDRVAVRWQLYATYEGAPFHIASVAIYRFEGDRIAEDWGIPIRGRWLDA